MALNVTEELKRAVWNKGVADPNNNTAIWRKDACLAWMQYSQYGNRNSMYGWEIDHINPHGGDSLANLQPLQWENNVAKGDGKLVCKVTAVGTENGSASQVKK